MTDFDTLFPRRTTAKLPPRKTQDELLALCINNGTRWKCEAEIVDILNTFVDEMYTEAQADRIVTSKYKRSLYAAAREIVRVVGEAGGPDFVRQAIAYNRKKQLDVSSLWSLTHYLPKYVTGKTHEKGTYEYWRGQKDFFK